MANPITDPTLWADYVTGAVPSSRWNGTNFEFLSYILPENNEAGLRYIGPTLTSSFPINIIQNSGDPLKLRVYPQGGGGPTQTDMVIGATMPITFTPSTLAITFFDPKGAKPYALDVVVSSPMPAIASCEELGRVTKANVSAYTRNRIHKSKVMAQEVRCLVANFNGALCKGRTIVTATWSVSNPMFVNLLQCQIGTNGRDTACLMQAQWRGASLVRCTALLDNGEQYTQYFELTINGYWFQGDVPLPQGPYTIVANA